MISGGQALRIWISFFRISHNLGTETRQVSRLFLPSLFSPSYLPSFPFMMKKGCENCIPGEEDLSRSVPALCPLCARSGRKTQNRAQASHPHMSRHNNPYACSARLCVGERLHLNRRAPKQTSVVGHQIHFPSWITSSWFRPGKTPTPPTLCPQGNGLPSTKSAPDSQGL